MSHNTSAVIALVLGILSFAAMQAFRSSIAESRATTILGGFLGSNIFLFILTAISNFEMDVFGENFHAKLIPEVVLSLLLALVSCALVHRVCVTTCIIFSVMLLYGMNKISADKYHPTITNVPAVAPSRKKK